MTRFFLGIEGGATKTEGILIDDLGEVRVTLQSGPSNPWVRNIFEQMLEFHFVVFFFKILGFDNVAKLLKQLIDDILVKGGISSDQIVAIVSTEAILLA